MSFSTRTRREILAIFGIPRKLITYPSAKMHRCVCVPPLGFKGRRRALWTGVEITHYLKLWRELLKDAKDAGIAILALAMLFGLSVGVALIFHYI
jgi:hypothetical protein